MELSQRVALKRKLRANGYTIPNSIDNHTLLQLSTLLDNYNNLCKNVITIINNPEIDLSEYHDGCMGNTKLLDKDKLIDLLLTLFNKE